MKPQRYYFLTAALLTGLLLSPAYGLNYLYYSNIEETHMGDVIRFWLGDTLVGPIRSNASIALRDSGLCISDWVIGGVWQPGPTPDPIDWAVTAPDSLRLPTAIPWLRAAAQAQNHFYVGDASMLAQVRLEDHNLHVCWSRVTPFDTLLVADYPLADTAVVFFDFPNIRLSGTMNSVLILGASGRIGLEDNVLYASSDPLTGMAPAGHPEKLAVIAEGEIKILNTWANGRENSNHLGQPAQTDPAYEDIVLDGLYAALGESFTFEQQNDADSGYVYSEDGLPHRDDRGIIYHFGSLLQAHRGYVHRTTNSSTGYLKNYRYDEALKFWKVPLFDARENELDRQSMDFGAVAVGDTVRDTLTIYNDYVPILFDHDSIVVAAPFAARNAREQTFPFNVRYWHPRIAVLFAPTAPGEFATTLDIPLPYYQSSVSVTLRGTCTTSGVVPRAAVVPQSFTLSAFPNPFNPTTTLGFALEQPGRVSLAVYDLLGRRVAELADGVFEAGEHRLLFDAAALSTGLYFARLESAHHIRVIKLALVK